MAVERVGGGHRGGLQATVEVKVEVESGRRPSCSDSGQDAASQVGLLAAKREEVNGADARHLSRPEDLIG